jgi:protein SCO1/2
MNLRRVAVLAAWLGTAFAAPPALANETLMPAHGVVVAPLGPGRALVRFDPVTLMLPAGTRTVTIPAGSSVRSGDEIDALLTGPPARLKMSDIVAAGPFTAGLPNTLVNHVLAEGDRLPAYTLVDQLGRPYRLDDTHGKTTILTFVFSRCPDQTICPAISAKFLYLERHLDPARYHLIEVTLDPPYDSPAVFARYGRAFDADPSRWTLLTGRASDVKDVIDEFGVSSLASGPANYIHGDLLAIADPSGTITSIIPTSAWYPDDVIAVARAADGESANPLRRFELETIKNVVAFCGGSSSMGTVILDTSLVFLILALSGGVLAWWGRRIFSGN